MSAAPGEASAPNDEVLDHIHNLVEEEKRLRSSHHGLTADDRQRLQAVEQELDRSWDLLRQRRARAEFDQNPDEAHQRTVDEVESYLQ